MSDESEDEVSVSFVIFLLTALGLLLHILIDKGIL
jgi:hypothetical protein